MSFSSFFRSLWKLQKRPLIEYVIIAFVSASILTSEFSNDYFNVSLQTGEPKGRAACLRMACATNDTNSSVSLPSRTSDRSVDSSIESGTFVSMSSGVESRSVSEEKPKGMGRAQLFGTGSRFINVRYVSP